MPKCWDSGTWVCKVQPPEIKLFFLEVERIRVSFRIIAGLFGHLSGDVREVFFLLISFFIDLTDAARLKRGRKIHFYRSSIHNLLI